MVYVIWPNFFIFFLLNNLSGCFDYVSATFDWDA